MNKGVNPYNQYFTLDELKDLKRLKELISLNLTKCSFIKSNLPEFRSTEVKRALNFLQSLFDETNKYLLKVKDLVPELTRKEFEFYFL